jgi:hypothetical protein
MIKQEQKIKRTNERILKDYIEKGINEIIEYN